jgi:hypothetical protein
MVLVSGLVLFAGSGAIAQSSSPERMTAEVERPNSFAISAGMGIDAALAPGFTDYLKSIDPEEKPSAVATDIEFFGAAEFPVSDRWGIKAEFTYLFKSYNLVSAFDGGTYNVFYSIQAPTLLAQYVIPGKGYFVKFAAGGGYHFGSVSQSVSTYGTSSSYTAKGIGTKIEVVGQTAFDEHLYAYIGGSMRWELLGTVESSDGEKLVYNNGPAATLSLATAGLTFGLIYYF